MIDRLLVSGLIPDLAMSCFTLEKDTLPIFLIGTKCFSCLPALVDQPDKKTCKQPTQEGGWLWCCWTEAMLDLSV